MRVPLVTKVGVGLFLGRTRATRLQMSRFIDRVHVRDPVVEEMAADNVAGLLRRSASGSEYKFVASHLDAARILHFCFEVPPFDDDDDRKSWIDSRLRGLMPVGFNTAEFVVSHHCTIGEDGTGSCIVAFARTDSVVNRDRELQDAGFTPVSILSPIAAIEAAFLMKPAFVAEEKWVLVTGVNLSLLLRYDAGIRTTAVELTPCPLSELANVVLEAISMLEPSPEKEKPSIFVLHEDMLGDDAEKYAEDVQASVSEKTAELNFQPFDLVVSKGLAATRIYDGLHGLELLSKESRRAARRRFERAETFTLARALSAVAVICVVTLVGLATGLAHFDSRTDQALQQLSSEMSRVDSLDERSRSLLGIVGQSRPFLDEKFQVAPVLETIGLNVPEGVRLSGLQFHMSEAGTIAASIGGTASSDHMVTGLLSQLRKQVRLSTARLVYSSRAGEMRLTRRVNHPDSLARFSIQVVESNGAAESE